MPYGSPVVLPNQRLNSHAIALKNLQFPGTQPLPATGGISYAFASPIICTNGQSLFALNKTPGVNHIMQSDDRGATWAVGLDVDATGRTARALVPIWASNGATPGVDVLCAVSQGAGTSGLFRWSQFNNAWGAFVNVGLGDGCNDIGMSQPLTLGLNSINPYSVNAQTLLAVGGVNGIGGALIRRSVANGVAGSWATPAGFVIPTTNGLFERVLFNAATNMWFVAKITAANVGEVYRSFDDGVTWTVTANVTPFPRNLYETDYGQGVFMGIGNDLAGVPTVVESSDGIQWKQKTVPIGTPDSCRFDKKGVWLLGTNGRVAMSADRETWKIINLAEIVRRITTSDDLVELVKVSGLSFDYQSNLAYRNNGTWMLMLWNTSTQVAELALSQGIFDYE